MSTFPWLTVIIAIPAVGALVLAVIPGAAHLTTLDNPTEHTRVVREFLRTVDSAH